MRRSLYTTVHEDFRRSFRSFLTTEGLPRADEWEASGQIAPEFIQAAGKSGFLGFEIPTEFGGLGIDDFRFNCVMSEEIVASSMVGDTFSIHNDILVPYFMRLTDSDQKARWLPGLTDGSIIPALAFTEPEAGSDLRGVRTTARREGDEYVLNGEKTFITNGSSANLVIVLARTGEREGRGLSLVVVERGRAGFDQQRPLKKVGRRAQDTAAMSFTDCRVPVTNLLGDAGCGLAAAMQNLPRERLSIAVLAIASAEHALGLAVEQCRTRHAFGGPLTELQSVRMTLADMQIGVSAMRSHVDVCVTALGEGDLTDEEAAAVKCAATDLQWSVVDQALQLFGGYGYMDEYPISRIWRDARIQRIYGGTNEIMREIVGRSVVKGVPSSTHSPRERSAGAMS